MSRFVPYHMGQPDPKQIGNVVNRQTAVKRASGKPQKKTCQIHVRDPNQPYLVGKCGELPRRGHFVVWDRAFADCENCLKKGGPDGNE